MPSLADNADSRFFHVMYFGLLLQVRGHSVPATSEDDKVRSHDSALDHMVCSSLAGSSQHYLLGRFHVALPRWYLPYHLLQDVA